MPIMSSYWYTLLQVFVVINIVAMVVMWLLRKIKVGQYDNKHVFITGCDTGFGFLLTKQLDKLGFYVFAGCLTDTGAKSVQKECSRKVTVVEVDVTKKDSVQKAVETVRKYLPKDKGLWAVVNNAGIAGPVAPTEWLTNEDFEQTIAIDLLGVIYVTKAFLPLVRKGQGRIVNMASICGRIAVATAPYSAAKFGVEGFTDALRHELYRTGCSVAVIEPGFFKTGIVSDKTIKDGLDQKFEALDEEVKQYYGTSYKNAFIERSSKFLSLVLSSNIHKVVDAYVHAITARYPKVRYTVGWDANTLLRILMMAPDWLTDLCFGILQERPAGRVR